MSQSAKEQALFLVYFNSYLEVPKAAYYSPVSVPKHAGGGGCVSFCHFSPRD